MDDFLIKIYSEMESSLKSAHYDRFLELEVKFYEALKVVESAAHHQEGFSLVEPLMELYGNALKQSLGSPAALNRKRIAYFIPNLDNDLAHIELFHNLFSNHVGADDQFEIFVFGFSRSGTHIESRLLNGLMGKGSIKVGAARFSHDGLLGILSAVNQLQVALLIVYSIPLRISSLVRALGSDRVAWVPTKFRLSCFRELRHRIGWGADSRFVHIPDGMSWHEVPLALPVDSIPSFSRAGRARNRLLSINREEKISSPPFLRAVADILERRPNASFSWTGRSERSDIKDYFRRRGVLGRVKFIGWIDPVQVMAEHDIFLDTFGLSGSVSAKCFSAGMPTVSFAGAGAWPEIFSNEFVLDDQFLASGIKISEMVCESAEQYVSSALSLLDDEETYTKWGEVQERLGKRYFCDLGRMYQRHIHAVQQIIHGEISQGSPIIQQHDIV